MPDPTDRDAGHQERDAPETLRLKSVSPSLTVDDLEASLEWYCDRVGFHLEEKHGHEGEVGGATLLAGEQRFMIWQDDWAKGRDRDKGEGFRLFLEASQPVDEVAAAIRKRGGTLESEPADMPWGGRAFDLIDPNGFKLTILEPGA